MGTIPSVQSALCPVCGSPETTDCIRISAVPIYCNVLHESRDAALSVPTGDMDLRFCGGCGHLFNAAFNPGQVDYNGEYENSLHYSDRFQEYANSLAQHLVALHELHDKTVIEIACGQGDFLQLLCALGGNKGIGFDPGHAPGRSQAVTGVDLTFIQDYFSDAYADFAADLICCRHALEHMHHPGDFLSMLRGVVGERATPLFFEVPNALFTLKSLGIWDLIYEHCGYFSESSLRAVFVRNGFRVKRVQTAFGGQFLSIHCLPAEGVEKTAQIGASGGDLAPLVEQFAHQYNDKVARWRMRLRDLRANGRRIVLWGAGSKGVNFMNVLKISDEVECLIDLNPHKHGRYIPGTGHEIRSPQALTEHQPDAVIVMNPLYREEIGRDLLAMGIEAEILVDEIK